MKKRDFETYQKRFRDFEILPKFSETFFEVPFATPNAVLHSCNPFFEIWICKSLSRRKKKKNSHDLGPA